MKLPSGRVTDENADIIGISHEGAVFGGYDGPLQGDLSYDGDWPEEDRVALADAMIKRWSDYRDGTRRKSLFEAED